MSEQPVLSAHIEEHMCQLVVMPVICMDSLHPTLADSIASQAD